MSYEHFTRAEHVAWAKERALRELDAPGQSEAQSVTNAFASMVSDLNKHIKTQDIPATCWECG